MKCPACKRMLREKTAGDITLDMCYGGCGGVWFDANELDHVSPRAAGALHSIWQLASRADDSNGPRECPRCPEQVLDRKWFSDSLKVEIDQCPKCGGIWLDDGEFTKIHEEIKRGRAKSPPWAVAMDQALTFIEDHPGES
ncbi:MAG TPA: zf-TFIIB domain-containing protein [Planctomycetota bacterium]|nr:zf-TFIIB domain-containing protein [Planctomycetota bacterium]